MATLADAKRILNVSTTDDDDLITQLITVATDYLAGIGVTVDPQPAPVSEAILILVSRFYARRSQSSGKKYEEVPGVLTTTYFDPAALDEADINTVRMLTAPYTEVTL